ncbi:hypothetical protein SteCoe_37769 [Stentor coeruleus]|uniref:RING-type domain-containing protein n=1 Tax=Stentor coeruleus TaxID=5963 RepID=A0A1R2AMS0_9CILI|nr:hypothetical protein SteCoe_37769 [Stentor coeruleus]
MLFQLTFCLIGISLAKFTVYSPDELRGLNIPYSYANFGNPAISPKYGKLQYEFLSECAFSGFVESNIALVIDTNIRCYYTDIIISAYNAGATFIIVLDPEYSAAYNMSSLYYNENLYEDFTALLIPTSFYEINLSKYENVWLSYEYDYVKSNSPNVELILSGNREQEYFIVNDLLNIVKNYGLDFNHFNVQMTYLQLSDNPIEDCLYYNLQIYCAYKIPTASGILIIENLLASLTFYNSLPQNDASSINVFLEYLLELYDRCDQNYEINCNYDVISDFGGDRTYDESLILNAQWNKDPDSHLVINGKYFPWFGSIELGYCSSFYEIPSKCPYCSTGCYADIQSMQTCLSNCNNTDCGYSNLHCLEIEETKCYYFMLNDGNCNSVCELEKDCSGVNTDSSSSQDNHGSTTDGGHGNHESSQGNHDSQKDNNNSGQESNNTTSQNNDISVSIILIAVLIPISFCFCGAIVIISVRVIIKKNHKGPTIIQNLRLSPVRYDSSMKIRGDKICVIDLMGIHENDMVIITPCQHVFHPQCIREWLGNHAHNPDRSCPICKTSLREYSF